MVNLMNKILVSGTVCILLGVILLPIVNPIEISSPSITEENDRAQDDSHLYVNHFCFIRADATIVLFELMPLQMPFLFGSNILGNIVEKWDLWDKPLGLLFIIPWIICDSIYNIIHNLPKCILPLVFFTGLPLGSNYCTLETWGPYGEWKIAPGYYGVVLGFIGIWLPKYVYGYALGVMALT